MNAETLSRHLLQAPVGQLLPVLFAWSLGPFVGAPAAAYVTGYAPLTHGLLVAAVVFGLVLTLLVAMPHPVWFGLLGVGLGGVFPSAYIGVRLLGRVTRRTSDRVWS